MKNELENLIRNISAELQNIKNQLFKQNNMMEMMLPSESSVSYICEATGKSRQSIHGYLHNNFLYEDDYYKKGGRVFMKKSVAIQLLMRHAGGQHAKG